MKKRLILIADSDPRTTIVGGVGTYTFQLAKQLYKKYAVTYFAKLQGGKQGSSPYEVQTITEKVGASNIKYLKGLYRIAKDLNTSSEDIIHAQRPDWLLPFTKKEGKKIVTLHGSHYKNIKTKKGKIWAAVYKHLERKGIKVADTVIAVDHETQREYQEWYPKYAEKIVYYPVGVDTSLFKQKPKATSRKKLGLPAKKKIYLFVGRFSKEKQVNEMINNLNKDEKLILVGKGELREKLEELAKGKDVIFVGSKNQRQLVEYYSAADALLLFSTHEGLPTVVLEAQACGLPVLSTPVGEVPRLITNGKNGFVGKNYRTLMNKKLSSSMSSAAKTLAKKYDWKQVAKNIHEEVYS